MREGINQTTSSSLQDHQWFPHYHMFDSETPQKTLLIDGWILWKPQCCWWNHMKWMAIFQVETSIFRRLNQHVGIKLLNHQFERFHGDVSSSAVASGSGTGGAAPNLVTCVDRNLFPGFDDVVPISSCLNCSISWGVAIRPHTPVYIYIHMCVCI